MPDNLGANLQIPDFEYGRCIDHDHLGVTYLGTLTSNGSPLEAILRRLRSKRIGTDLCRDRAKFIAEVHHPSIRTILRFDEEEHGFYYVTPFHDTVTLKEIASYYSNNRSTLLPLVTSIGAVVCDALEHLHATRLGTESSVFGNGFGVCTDNIVVSSGGSVQLIGIGDAPGSSADAGYGAIQSDLSALALTLWSALSRHAPGSRSIEEMATPSGLPADLRQILQTALPVSSSDCGFDSPATMGFHLRHFLWERGVQVRSIDLSKRVARLFADRSRALPEELMLDSDDTKVDVSPLFQVAEISESSALPELCLEAPLIPGRDTVVDTPSFTEPIEDADTSDLSEEPRHPSVSDLRELVPRLTHSEAERLERLMAPPMLSEETLCNRTGEQDLPAPNQRLLLAGILMLLIAAGIAVAASMMLT